MCRYLVKLRDDCLAAKIEPMAATRDLIIAMIRKNGRVSADETRSVHLGQASPDVDVGYCPKD